MSSRGKEQDGSTRSHRRVKSGDTSRAREAIRNKAAAPPGRQMKLRNFIAREALLSSLGCLWIIIGLVIVGVSAGVWYGSQLAVETLTEIGERDFSGPLARIRNYEDFFDQLKQGAYEVQQGKTNILQGKVTYMWVVRPEGGHDFRTFQWEHDLEANEVNPRTNPALCLDVYHGYMTEKQAEEYTGLISKAEYNPFDTITQAIVETDFSVLSPADLAADDEGIEIPKGPVEGPLLSPTEAQTREEEAQAEAEAEAEAEAAARADEDAETGAGENSSVELEDGVSINGDVNGNPDTPEDDAGGGDEDSTEAEDTGPEEGQ